MARTREQAQYPAASIAWAASAILCWLMLFAPSAHASGPAAERWKTIATPHFRINYHRSVEAMAEDVAEMCEDAHDLLAADFGFSPRRKTEVVLIDASESANGSANSFPRGTIRLFAVPSSSHDSRADSGHWMWEMVLHEYAHILHMEQIYGWIRVINFPFGRKFMPNQNLPRWVLEGTATAIESRYTGRGRTRSNFYRMQRDAALREGTVPTLAQLSATAPKYPYAGFWYLVGGFFIEYIGDVYGWDAVYEAYTQQGRRLRPWAVNFMIWKTVGKTMDALYDEWRDHARAAAWKHSGEITDRGLIEPQRLSEDGHETRWIAATLDGRMPHWIRSDGKDDATLVTPEKPDARRIRVRTSSPFTLSPDGRYAIISRSTRVKDGYTRNDLFRVDLERKRIRRLSRGLRASEPAMSPDGRHIAYIRPKNGRFDLHIYDIESKEAQRIAKADDWTTFGHPAWSPDGQTIYASMSEIAGGRHLYAFDAQTHARTRLTSGESIDNSPRLSPDGRWLFYTSDRDGTYNVYARDLSHAENCIPGACDAPEDAVDVRVTRVRTGVFSPVVVQQDTGCELWMSAYSAEGFHIASLDLQDDCSPLGQSATQPNDAEEDYERVASRKDKENDPAELFPRPPSNGRDDLSSPRRYLTGIRAHPWSWAPIYQRVGPHRQVGFSTEGEDPAQRFAWRADLSIGDPFNQLRWAIDLRFRMTTPEFYVNTTRSVNRGSMRINTRAEPYDQMVTTASVGTAYNFSGIRASQRIDLSYNWEKREFWDDKPLHYDPGGLQPIVPVLGGFSNLNLRYSLSNLRSYTRSVSVERGWSFSLSLRIRAPWLGAHYQSRELSFSLKKAVPIPRLRRHALVFRLQGAMARSRFDRPISYSIGGLQDQNLWEAIQTQLGASNIMVRGFSAARVRGQQYLLGGAEYRFPLLWIDWGHSTLPMFFERIHGAVFIDAATAFDNVQRQQHTLVGVGGELRLDLTAGYYAPQSFRVGVARGLGPLGQWQGYVLFGRGF